MQVGLVIGTRPEAIKLGPVYRELAKLGHTPIAILSGQHGDVLDPILDLFSVSGARRLGCISDERGLPDFAGRLMVALTRELGSLQLDMLAIQGDTTTAFVGAVVGSYLKVPVAHIEAGLRTATITEPFPEELNRRMISEATSIHFAPTAGAARNLAAEGIAANVYVVGNTVVDAAIWTANHPQTKRQLAAQFPGLLDGPYVLVTAHRRESFGAPMESIAEAVSNLADTHSGYRFIIPLHTNPNARKALIDKLASKSNVTLSEPVTYQTMIGLISNAGLILTDSGGIQEEAPSFGVPVLVLRNVTERPEGIAAGCAFLVGTDRQQIETGFGNVADQIDRVRSKIATNPYGDGKASNRIVRLMDGSAE